MPVQRYGPLRRESRPAGPRRCTCVPLISHHPALAAHEVVAFLETRAVAGVEEVVEGTYRRSLRLPHGPGVIAVTPGAGRVAWALESGDPRDGAAARGAVRRLLRLDADPVRIEQHLGADALIGALVRSAPGRRVPGHPDAAELAVRALLGQQVSVTAAATVAARLVAARGEPLARPRGGVTHLFPSPAAIAAVDPRTLAMPGRRARALTGLAAALAAGAPVTEELPGVGPWTAGYVALRLGDDDVFLATDLGVRRGLERLGGRVADAERWRPLRSYAVAHLWMASGQRSSTPSAASTA
jgi:AraC family transcriptional regulator of adaptative response / DNA-3-methyladenine glycosylase II